MQEKVFYLIKWLTLNYKHIYPDQQLLTKEIDTNASVELTSTYKHIQSIENSNTG